MWLYGSIPQTEDVTYLDRGGNHPRLFALTNRRAAANSNSIIGGSTSLGK